MLAPRAPRLFARACCGAVSSPDYDLIKRTSKPSLVSEIAGAHQHAFVLLTAGSGGGRSRGCNFSTHALSNFISASRKQSDPNYIYQIRVGPASFDRLRARLSFKSAKFYFQNQRNFEKPRVGEKGAASISLRSLQPRHLISFQGGPIVSREPLRITMPTVIVIMEVLLVSLTC